MVYVIVAWPHHTRTSYTEFDLENELLWYARNLSHVRTLSLRRGARGWPAEEARNKADHRPCD
jgi:hypothetical protein